MKKIILSTLSPKQLRQHLDSKKRNRNVKAISESISEENPTLGEFIKRHKLDKSMLFDANKNQISSVYGQMKKLGKQFAYNTIPCYQGHTYRDRKNHCLICETSRITFQLRNSSEGFVYIAGSVRKRMMKIGVTDKVFNRESSLNKSGYADTDDWKILYWFYSEKIGEIENEVKSKLKVHNTLVPFLKYSKEHKIAEEVFFCGFDRIFTALKEVIHENDVAISQELLKSDHISFYQFRNWVKIKK
jgi:hypothetical protein